MNLVMSIPQLSNKEMKQVTPKLEMEYLTSWCYSGDSLVIAEQKFAFLKLFFSIILVFVIFWSKVFPGFL